MPHDHLRVLAHPLRLRILSLLTGTALSAAEAARELGETQANVSYHVRRLYDAGLLEVAEEVRIRGGRAKRYRHQPDSGKRLTRRAPGEEKLLTKAIANELLRRASSRATDRPASRCCSGWTWSSAGSGCCCPIRRRSWAARRGA